MQTECIKLYHTYKTTDHESIHFPPKGAIPVLTLTEALQEIEELYRESKPINLENFESLTLNSDAKNRLSLEKAMLLIHNDGSKTRQAREIKTRALEETILTTFATFNIVKSICLEMSITTEALESRKCKNISPKART